MKLRAITGFLFVSIMLASLMLGAFVFTLFVLALSVVALDEFYHLITTADIKPQKWMGIASAIAIYLAMYHYLVKDQPLQQIFLCIPFIVGIFIVELYRKQQRGFHNIAYTLLGLLFAAVPFYFFYALAFVDGVYNFHYPLAFLLLLWASDTGAYLLGRNFGKHKLFERHSPKKTWEGLFGGVLSSALAAVLISNYFQEISLLHWFLLSVIISIVGTFGDLSESMLKRGLSVKDSGTLLPGHGGILDRFDGLLLAAPLVFMYLQLLR